MNITNRLLLFAFLILMITISSPLFAQENQGRPRVEISLTDKPPLIDGELIDAVWTNATVIDRFTEVDPDEGAPSSPKTKIMIMRDSEFLYVGFICMEPEPNLIVLHDMHREGFQQEDDAVKITLDTFEDGKSGYYFLIAAAGGRLDSLVADNGQRLNYSWDGFWKGKTWIGADRWTAELAIPFQTMAFGGQDVWRVNFERWRGADRSRHRWTALKRNYSVFTMSDAGELAGMKGLKQGYGLELKPYMKIKRSRIHKPRSASTVGDLGGDISWRINPQLTGSVTFNTDFAETEADSRRINLTRYSLFFPEKRDFFLQDSTYFQFGWGGGFRDNPNITPYFSRRIGLAPNGEEIPIEYGARLCGRMNGFDMGFLQARTESDSSAGAPSGNLMVARPAWRMTEELTLGAIFTSGNPSSRKPNTVGGMDLRFSSTSKLPGLWSLTGYVLRSDDEETDSCGSAYGFRTSLKTSDWNYSLENIYAQDKFHPALGFVRRPGEKNYSGSINWSPRPDSSTIRNYSFSFHPSLWTKSDGSLISKTLSTGLFSVNWHSGDRFNLTHRLNYDKVESDFTLVSGDVIPRGNYDWQSLSAGYTFSRKRALSGGVSIEGGGWYDGKSVRCSADSTWRPSANVELVLSYSQNNIRLKNGNFTTRIETLKMNYDFTPDLRLATYTQADNISDNLGFQSRFRWTYEDGRELHFVVNSSWVEEDHNTIIPVEHDFTLKAEYAIRF